MARTKEFDPQTALVAAMSLFLRQGYESTSVGDLVAHLGISRASLYATFGCKEELYRQALDLYTRTQPVDVAALMSQPGPVVPQVRALVEQYVRSAAVAPDGRCLVVNAAIERMTVDDQVARRVRASWDELQLALAMGLTRARAQGELSPEIEVTAAARFIVVLLQGIRVIANSDDSAIRLAGLPDQVMAVLGS